MLSPEPRATVLHVVDCLNVGGTERQMFELLRRLDRGRWRPLLACFHPEGELLERLRALDLEPRVFPLRGSLARPNTLVQVARLALLCRRERVRVLHAHDFYSNLLGVAAAGLAGVRSIASRRDLGHWLTPGQRRALRVACGRADVVLANAEAVGALATRCEAVDGRKLRVVPNGIDLQAIDAQARRPPDPPLPPQPPGLPRIAMIGSMHLPTKGHGDLLAAAARLKARGQRAQWLLVGAGALQGPLTAQANALGLGGDVHFLGRRDDLPSVLARVELLVHPSWTEGFPNAILEAMAAARPVVATRVGGCAELVVDGDTGFLVEPRQPDALADAVARALADPEAAHLMGLHGRSRVEALFSLDRMTATVDGIYRGLAS